MLQKIANIKDGKIDRSRKSYTSDGKMVLSQLEPDDGLDMQGMPRKYNDYPDFDGLRQDVESWQMDDPQSPMLLNELRKAEVLLEDSISSGNDIITIRKHIANLEGILNSLKREVNMREKAQWVAQGYAPGELAPEPPFGQGDPFGDQ
jgi:hypothetical protein